MARVPRGVGPRVRSGPEVAAVSGLRHAQRGCPAGARGRRKRPETKLGEGARSTSCPPVRRFVKRRTVWRACCVAGSAVAEDLQGAHLAAHAGGEVAGEQRVGVHDAAALGDSGADVGGQRDVEAIAAVGDPRGVLDRPRRRSPPGSNSSCRRTTPRARGLIWPAAGRRPLRCAGARRRVGRAGRAARRRTSCGWVSVSPA